MVSVSKRVWRSSSRRRRTRRRRMTRRSGESLESAGALCRVPAPSRLSQRSKKGLRSADCWWNNSLTFTRSLRSLKTLVAKLCSPTKEGSWSEPVLNNLRNLCNVRKSTHVRKPHVGQVQPWRERLQLHLDRDQASVAGVFGIWERVSGKQKCVSVYLDRLLATFALASGQ